MDNVLLSLLLSLNRCLPTGLQITAFFSLHINRNFPLRNSYIWTNPQFLAFLLAFTKEILNGKVQLLGNVSE